MVKLSIKNLIFLKPWLKRQWLGCYLDKIPDQPRDELGGWLPLAVDQITGNNSNYIVYWATLLRKTNPEYN